MFNKDVTRMELYKVNFFAPLEINVSDGAIGYNDTDTHHVKLISGIWHVKDGPYGAAHNEYLAYLLGKEMNLPVPETVLYMIEEDTKYHMNTRIMRGKTFHSAQKYVHGELGKYIDYSSFSGDKLEHLIREIARMDIFDYLIGNDDRHNKNFIINEDGKLHLIDNGYGGIGNTGLEFCCNRSIPESVSESKFYLEETISYQKNLISIISQKALGEIGLAMKEFNWESWNCAYKGPYKICHPPTEETIDEFFQIFLKRAEKMADKPSLPYPLNKKF